MVERLPQLPERVETERLVLRRWTSDDAPALHDAVSASIEHLRLWMPWIAFEPTSLEDRVKLIAGWNDAWERGGDVLLGVFLDGDVVGSTGLHRRYGPGVLEVGYWIAVDHVRRGFATELTRALTDAAFEVPGIDRVNVATNEANVASAGVPAALGFDGTYIEQREPQAPSETGRTIVWTVTATEWAQRQHQASGRSPGRA